MIDVTQKLKELGLQAEAILKESYGVNAIEGKLLEMLQTIKSNPEYKNDFVKVFQFFIDDGDVPYEATQFCMRELQWPEIKQYAVSMMENSNDPRVQKVANEILAVYEDEWEDEDLFNYYSKE